MIISLARSSDFLFLRLVFARVERFRSCRHFSTVVIARLVLPISGSTAKDVNARRQRVDEEVRNACRPKPLFCPRTAAATRLLRSMRLFQGT